MLSFRVTQNSKFLYLPRSASILIHDYHSVDLARELLPAILTILRRAVRHNRQGTVVFITFDGLINLKSTKGLTYECFKLLGALDPKVVSGFITRPPADDRQASNVDDKHPVALIRYYLSSREVNDIYLFLSCLACLDPCIWAGGQSVGQSLLGEDAGDQPNSEETETDSPKAVLDQLEVEKVLRSMESDDEKIRLLVSHLSTSSFSDTNTYT